MPDKPAAMGEASRAAAGGGSDAPAKMVGGATGAVMTAVTMIFEMTRDYNIVMPMILAVAVSVGVRRLLSPESIYTLKLFRCGHFLPKALHADIFLERRARDLMDSEVTIATAETNFEEFLRRPGNRGRMLHVVVTRANRIYGVLRIDTALRHGLEQMHAGITLGDAAQQNFTIVRENEAGIGVIRRLSRKRAVMAVAVRDRRIPRPTDILGVITKERVADSVTDSIQIYPG